MAFSLSGVVTAWGDQPLDARIVIAADDGAIVETVGALLRRLGFESSEQRLADASVDRLAEGDVDVLVVEVQSNDSPGLRLCRRLKKDIRTHLVPVIAVERGDGRSRLPSIDGGADHWIAWPIAEDEMAARLLALLRTRSLVRLIAARQDSLRLRRDWVRYLVHDLRTPLSVTASNVNFVAEEVEARLLDRGEVVQALADTRAALRRMAGMIDDLLDNDRLENGTLRPRFEDVDLGELVQDTVRSVRSYASDVRPILVGLGQRVQLRADRTLVGRVLANLLSNALRYGPSGKPIHVDVGADAQFGRVEVANSGPPIHDSDRERIFQPFVRLDASEGEPGDAAMRHGAGLGLSFCRLAVETHGGRIGVINREGRVVFQVELPLAQRRA